MASNRSTAGAYDLAMGDSSVRVEDAGDLLVRQAMVARPKSVSRDASVGDARILFANPKNRLLLVVDDDDLYVGDALPWASDAFDNRLVVVDDDGRLEGLLCLNKRDGYLCVDVRE